MAQVRVVILSVVVGLRSIKVARAVQMVMVVVEEVVVTTEAGTVVLDGIVVVVVAPHFLIT